MSRRLASHRFAAVAALVLCACAPRQADPFAQRPTQPYALEASVLDLVVRYGAAQSGLQALSGRAGGTASEGRKRRPFKQAFALRLPDSLRIEVQASTGQTVALFVCDGQRLYFKQRGEDAPFVGPAAAAAVQQTLGYALEVGELLDSLLGRFAGADLRPGQILQRAGDLVYLPSGSGRLEVGFDVRGGVLRSRTYYDPPGQRSVVVLYGDYTSVQGQIVPSRLQIADLRNRSSVELKVTKLTLNPALRPSVFQAPRR